MRHVCGDKRIGMRISLCLLGALCLLAFFSSVCAASQARELWCASPWLASIARFIGGSYTEVKPLAGWDAQGKIVSQRKTPPAGTILALDPIDAQMRGLKADSPRVRLLYKKLPFPLGQRDAIFFDPSTLPFVAQRILNVLSSLDPENYGFYQRRLAEFQSRMESTIEVGRHLLPTSKILDLTGTVSPWIGASMEGVVRPPQDLWLSWTRGENLEALKSAVAEAVTRKWILLLDPWTPRAVASACEGVPRAVLLPAPEPNEEFFSYLQHLYLTIRESVKE